jgi:hypothetical protein
MLYSQFNFRETSETGRSNIKICILKKCFSLNFRDRPKQHKNSYFKKVLSNGYLKEYCSLVKISNNLVTKNIKIKNKQILIASNSQSVVINFIFGIREAEFSANWPFLNTLSCHLSNWKFQSHYCSITVNLLYKNTFLHTLLLKSWFWFFPNYQCNKILLFFFSMSSLCRWLGRVNNE